MTTYMGAKTAAVTRPKNAKPLPPLRTFRELAEELGVPEGRLKGMLNGDGAPKPRISHRCGNTYRSYYEPAEFRAWWRARITA
jgi:hypothetical protein